MSFPSCSHCHSSGPHVCGKSLSRGCFPDVSPLPKPPGLPNPPPSSPSCIGHCSHLHRAPRPAVASCITSPPWISRASANWNHLTSLHLFPNFSLYLDVLPTPLPSILTCGSPPSHWDACSVRMTTPTQSLPIVKAQQPTPAHTDGPLPFHVLI